MEFGPIDADALFGGVIFKMDIKQFLTYAFFLNALGRIIANEMLKNPS